jgi:hypothetical protein
VAVTVWTPSASVDASHDQAPATTVAVQSAVAPSCTVTVAPVSPVPATVGVASGTAVPSAGAVMMGASGAEVSTVNATGALAGERFPAASVWVPVTVCDPSASTAESHDQTPPLTTAVHRMVVPSATSTVDPVSPVPVMVGVASGTAAPAAGAVMTGAAGAVLSTVNVTGALAGETLPATSVWVAVTVCAPSTNVDAGQDHGTAGHHGRAQGRTRLGDGDGRAGLARAHDQRGRGAHGGSGDGHGDHRSVGRGRVDDEADRGAGRRDVAGGVGPGSR